MKKLSLFAILLAILGVVAAYFLFPEEQELARMEVQDFNYEDPGQVYEARFAAGDHSVEVVQQLVRIYTNTGNIERAIEVLEVYVEEHPNDEQVLTQLAELYQFAQRNDEYIAILERKRAQNETPEILRQLADLYNFTEQKDKQLEVLEALYLLEPEGQRSAETLRELAIFRSFNKEFAGAVALCEELLVQHEQYYDESDAMRHMNGLMKLGRALDAKSLALRYQSTPESSPTALAAMVDMLHYEGDVKYAREVLEVIGSDEIMNSPELLQSYILVMLSDGRSEEAYAMLIQIHEQGQLSSKLVPDLMVLAAVHDNYPLFETLVEEYGLNTLNETQMASIWVNGYRARAYEITRNIERHVAESSVEDYPVMRTVLATKNRSNDRHERVRNLIAGGVNDNVALIMAEVMAMFRERAYAREFIAQLPPLEELQRSELTALEVIYLQLNDLEGADRFIKSLAADGRLEEMSPVGLRTAASLGRASILRQWHAREEGNHEPALVNDLFYQASNQGHLNLALEIMQWQSDAKWRAKATDNIASIYARTGRYAEALKIYNRTPVANESDVQDRLYLLSKLAPKSQTYRNQLVDLARGWYNRSSLQLKESFVYALQDSGDANLALPFMQALADERGGNWLVVYAEELEKSGNLEEATAYRLKAAEDPNFDPQTKLGLAYALADRGYRGQAETLLLALLKQPDTRIPAMQQLVYLWPVRPEWEKLQWLRSYWHAASGEEQKIYGELLTGAVSEDQLVAFVQEDKNILMIPAINEQYFALLAKDNMLAPEIGEAIAYADQSQDASPLVTLGNLSRDYSNYDEAQTAYDAALAVDPYQPDALIGGTLVAFDRADYAASRNYYERYLASPSFQQGVYVPRDVQYAAHAYAEVVRRDNGVEAAQPIYRDVMSLIDAQQYRDARSLSLAAQSAAWLGDINQAEERFATAFRIHPMNQTLRADRAALLLENKYYDAAEHALAMVQTDLDAPQNVAMPTLSSRDVFTRLAPELAKENTQLVVYSAPDSLVPRTWLAPMRKHPAVSYVSEGYDSVLIATKLGYEFALEQNATDWVVSLQDAREFDPRSESAQLALRKGLLESRLALETGDLNRSVEIVSALEEDYAGDPQYFGFASNSYFYTGLWPQAKHAIDDAVKRSPNNQDIAQLKRQIDRTHANRVRADATWINRGDNDELRTELSAESQVAKNVRIGGIIRNHKLDVEGRLQPSGAIEGEQVNRQTGELYGIVETSADAYAKASLFANADTVGGGVEYNFANALGFTTVTAEYHRPYFEFVEGIVDDAVRDRIGIHHSIKPSTRWAVGAGVSYNNYSIDGHDDVFSSVGVDGEVTYALQQSSPYIGLGYGLLAEYEVDSEQQTTATNQTYRQLPQRSREIHFGSVTIADELTEKTFGSLLLGYGWDRLGGHGPSAEANIHHNIYGDWDVGARAFYGLDGANTGDGSNDLGMFNAYLQYRFDAPEFATK